MMKDVYKCVTDERLVLDFVMVGFKPEDVTVKTARVNGGNAFKITVEGHRSARKNTNGIDVPCVASDKYLPADVKFVVSDDTDFGDELFRSKTFNSLDYELDKLVWSISNGILRISIPKTELARGTEVKPVDNADADSSGVID